MWRLPALALLLALLAAGCQMPRDADGTLDRIQGGSLRVGVVDAEPWVSLAGPDPSGVEVGLIRELAAQLQAEVDYTTGGEQELVEALKVRELDVVIGGITDKTRWSKEVAMTKPYLTTHLVVGVPPDVGQGEPIDAIAVERGTQSGHLVERKTDDEVVRVERLDDARGRPAAVDDWLLDDLGLTERQTLHADEHVMLVAPGENAWLVKLERFLLDRKQRALRLLEQEGRP
jgi:polar amino acid transport system substrate-binding protein